MEKSTDSPRRIGLPLFVLLCGLGATVFVTYLISENLRIKQREQIKEAANHLERTIQARMEAYIGLLRGGAGLFAANPFVSLEQFRNFYERLEIRERYPGLQGYGYTVRFSPEKLDSLVASMRSQGLNNFNVWPEGPREEYHSIVYLEPLDLRNQKALGYDMFTETRRRAAMEAARDHGNPRFSRKVRLVQELEGEPGQPGFLLYLPIYLGGQIPSTQEERQAELQGFVYAPFRAGDLFSGMIPRSNTGLAYSIWDGTEPTSDALLYQSHSDFRLASRLDLSVLRISGAVWTLGVAELPGSGSDPIGFLLWFVPLLGGAASVLLSWFTYTEAMARARSERAANDLFNQREWLQVTLASIGDAVISTDHFGRIQFMNGIAEELTGWRFEEARSKPLREIFHIQNEKTGEAIDNPADRVLITGATIKLANHTALTDRHGILRFIDDSAAPIRDRRGKIIGAVLVFREITERRRYERRSAAQQMVTKILAEAPTLQEATSQILPALCDQLRFDFAVLWKFDADQHHAISSILWHSPALQLDRFEESCRSFAPRRGEGLPGVVWQMLAPEWVTDFSHDPQNPRASAARALGLKTAFAFPILIESEAFGAIELFSRESTPADLELLKIAQGLGTQIGQFVRRKRAEEALAESEDLYRAISETAADGIIVFDEHSRILTVNSAVERIFGFSRDELIDASIKKLLPERVHRSHDDGMTRFLETGEKSASWSGVELPGLHQDGHELPLEISFGVARRGSSYLFTALVRDITRRKESERQLRETEERLALLVRRAEEYAIITTDPEGRISTWNPGAQRIFGYTDDEVLGRGIDIFSPGEEKNLPARQLARAAEGGQTLDEGWQIRKDGSRFWATGSIVCLRSEEGTVRGFAKILRDITERKQAEEAIQELNQQLEIRVLRRTAALQESKEQMEAFSYTVAHDLRAPLRAMQGFAHALVEDYKSRLDSAGIDYLQRIMSSAQRMDALIQDLLEYSQLSRSDLSFKPVSVEEAIRNALRAHEDHIRECRAEVQLTLDHFFVRAHPSTLENVLGNLISNALKFIPKGQTPRLQIRAVDQGETVRISIQDNGIGIAPEHHDRIFRVFERLHGQDAFPGTGIGLAIVRKGVERMGGTIGVTSDLHQGSLFWIELPREDSPA